jgi:hypothetical protein
MIYDTVFCQVKTVKNVKNLKTKKLFSYCQVSESIFSLKESLILVKKVIFFRGIEQQVKN